jgi:arginase
VPWALIEAPLDSSGAGRGEERAPAALRAAGLAELFGATDSDAVVPPLRDPVRDPGSGVIAFEDLRRSSQMLQEAVRATIRRGASPLVLGGDCSLLPGAIAGAREALGPVGLWFVDGHADYLDGETSPTGEAADMELAMLTGDGPAGLVDPVEAGPLMRPRDVVVLGHRPASSHPDVALELERVPASVARLSADQIAAEGATEVGERWERELAARGPAWLHLDLDVLDEEELSAVSYPQPRGLDWHSFSELARPFLASPALAGISVADLNPDLDRDGSQARRVVRALAEALYPDSP